MLKIKRILGGTGLLACAFLIGCGNQQVEVPLKAGSATTQSVTGGVGESATAGQEGVTEVGEKPYLNDLQAPEGVDYIIEDENFVQDMDQLYMGLDDYVGRTLQYEGMVSEMDPGRYTVIRIYDMGHEDHAHEIFVGLDTTYEGTWPKDGTWVRVVGTVAVGEPVNEGEEPFPVLVVSELVEIPPGLEKVTH
ncbi:MAG: hypothetical protein RR090_09135 [Niameybacter sp.]|uniref:TIGR03943 family putative permease subunit n=1 Tax=Niameybacter sp. TaxID=2033640 RepID=UPI002FC68A27